MEVVVVIVMIAVGGTIALATLVSMAAAERERQGVRRSVARGDRQHVAASILFNLLVAGGAPPDEAMHEVRTRAGLPTPAMPGIDMASWSERYALMAVPEERQWLLETAVQLLAARKVLVPLHQYSALLDLTFGLGFQIDALTRLREQYGFEYVDHAKHARPREADRGGGAAPLFVRDVRSETALLAVLGLNGSVTRPAIIAAYRRLAAQHHPDRVFGEPVEVQQAAATRFIEITRAYEVLLAIHPD